jgi:hypothetical protein
MARAIAADRVRTSARVGAAATRRHPMLCLTPVIVLVISAIAVMFMTVKPLPVAAQGRVAASIPTFRLGMQNHGQQRHGYSARTAAGPAAQSRHPQAVQSRAACTTRLPSSGRWPFLTPPSRPELPASFTSRCMRLRPFKRWLTHLP